MEVVRDPNDSTHVIVAGTPEDWADRLWLNVPAGAPAPGFGLVAALVPGNKLVPERADPAVERLFAAMG